ncbi:hypothetical protein GCM10027294_39260 [Marinactinospora endophytica]
MTEPRRDPRIVRMVHQVLMPGFVGTEPPGWLARAVDEGTGAVLYFGPNLTGDPAALSRTLHGLRPDLVLASDEEGGRVTRLHAVQGSPYPGHGELGATGDLARTRAVAHAMGGELRGVGIDAALAPVVDVNVNPRNPVIGPRAFGADPREVAGHGTAFIRGLQEAGVAAAAKHFPGHGDTEVDSHLALPVVDVDLATLRRRELPPFAAAIQAGARMVMVGHIRVPALGEAPASLDPGAYALLRGELGFEGVAVTDALDMRAVARHLGRGELDGIADGAVGALRAGADLLCLGNPHEAGGSDEKIFGATVERIFAALSDGTVPVARLAEAAGRVGELAAWCARRRP